VYLVGSDVPVPDPAVATVQPIDERPTLSLREARNVRENRLPITCRERQFAHPCNLRSEGELVGLAVTRLDQHRVPSRVSNPDHPATGDDDLQRRCRVVLLALLDCLAVEDLVDDTRWATVPVEVREVGPPVLSETCVGRAGVASVSDCCGASVRRDHRRPDHAGVGFAVALLPSEQPRPVLGGHRQTPLDTVGVGQRRRITPPCLRVVDAVGDLGLVAEVGHVGGRLQPCRREIRIELLPGGYNHPVVGRSTDRMSVWLVVVGECNRFTPGVALVPSGDDVVSGLNGVVLGLLCPDHQLGFGVDAGHRRSEVLVRPVGEPPRLAQGVCSHVRVSRIDAGNGREWLWATAVTLPEDRFGGRESVRTGGIADDR
jgi:hypothetical protein